LAGDRLETKKQVSKCKATIDEIKGTYPLDLQKLAKAEMELEAYANGLKRIEAWEKELFGDK
jgi:hypothetical protein